MRYIFISFLLFSLLGCNLSNNEPLPDLIIEEVTYKEVSNLYNSPRAPLYEFTLTIKNIGIVPFEGRWYIDAGRFPEYLFGHYSKGSIVWHNKSIVPNEIVKTEFGQKLDKSYNKVKFKINSGSLTTDRVPESNYRNNYFTVKIEE